MISDVGEAPGWCPLTLSLMDVDSGFAFTHETDNSSIFGSGLGPNLEPVLNKL